jgi:protein gp37
MIHTRLSESGIEYLTHTWSFLSGCEHSDNGVCPVGRDCWARLTTERFPDHYPNGFKPTLYPDAFESPLQLKQPSRIGVCFMGDLFQESIDPEMTSFRMIPGSYNIAFRCNDHFMPLKEIIFKTIDRCRQHTFIFLTKNPRGLLKWGKFPDNCHVGISMTYPNPEALAILKEVNACVKFISIEPMFTDFSSVNLKDSGVKWIIIGALTGGRVAMHESQKKHSYLTLIPMKTKWSLQPPVEWIKSLVDKADEYGAPVFLKDNLRPLLSVKGPWAYHKEDDKHYLRQAYPVTDAVLLNP